jgi:hypothetical protein
MRTWLFPYLTTQQERKRRCKMQNTRIPAILVVVGLLLGALVVGAGLAQAPNTGPEPDLPLRSPDARAPQGSSQPAAPAGEDDPWDANLEPTEAQRNSSAPITPGVVVPAPAAVPGPAEEPPRGIDASDALVSLRIVGTALKPRNSNATYVPSGGGGCFYSTASSYTIFNTGVFLPQGSWVDTMRMYYFDSSATDAAAWFSVYDLYGNLVQEWQVTSSGDSGNGFNDTALISHTIDYSLYSYAINWRPYVLGAEMQNCGFRLFYEPPSHFAALLPVVSRDNP